MEQSLAFYGDILGYDHMLLDNKGTNQELAPLSGEGVVFRQVLLSRSQRSTSVFPMLDGGRLRLVQTLDYQGRKIYQDRRWGDIGQMECCFDVSDIQKTAEYLQSKNVEIVLPPTFLNMGSGSSGFFAYIRDPDGNLIEFVEVKKIAWLPPRIVSSVLQLLSPCFSKIIR
jgi:catechol 2,3-dioxygenase-like lactoylglutathione lyase family enzyme